jgi:RsiW-degrading membrane proteinase PrsW (M82 family)
MAPFMHVIWTANAAAALWMVKGEKKFEWSMLGSARFLRVFASSVILHFIWNSNITIIPLPLIYDVKFLILGFISWVIAFMLIQAGLKQLNDARKLEIERLSGS